MPLVKQLLYTILKSYEFVHIICWQWLLRVQNSGPEHSLIWKKCGKGEKKMVGLKTGVVGDDNNWC